LKRIPFILILLTIFIGPACEEEGTCTDDVISRIRAGFYVRDSIGERDTTLSSVTFYGVSRPDSLLYDGSSGEQEIFFPLSYSEENLTRFVFTVGSRTDVINIWHQSRLQMFSYACGFTTVHDLYSIGYEQNIIDTIAITESFVNPGNAENIKIYIRPIAADSIQ
jgi:hypothetical protein